MLYEVISVLEEDGAEVVTVNFSTVADKFFTRVMLRYNDISISMILKIKRMISTLY